MKTKAGRCGEVCVIGDACGHLQLALGLAAGWHALLGFDAIFLLGDLGAFSSDAAIDAETRRRTATEPCELEVLDQWLQPQRAPWLDVICAPRDRGGLGLDCPVVCLHGDRDDFSVFEGLARGARSTQALHLHRLPTFDPKGRLHYLPSGWRCRLPGGAVVAGLGGIEARGDRAAAGSLESQAIDALRRGPAIDLLLSHQGPSRLQGRRTGSKRLDNLLDDPLARVWCYSHCHAVGRVRPDLGITVARPGQLLVKQVLSPAFRRQSAHRGEPGAESLCRVLLAETVQLERRLPPGWQAWKRQRWRRHADGLLIAPGLDRD